MQGIAYLFVILVRQTYVFVSLFFLFEFFRTVVTFLENTDRESRPRFHRWRITYVYFYLRRGTRYSLAVIWDDFSCEISDFFCVWTFFRNLHISEMNTVVYTNCLRIAGQRTVASVERYLQRDHCSAFRQHVWWVSLVLWTLFRKFRKAENKTVRRRLYKRECRETVWHHWESLLEYSYNLRLLL